MRINKNKIFILMGILLIISTIIFSFYFTENNEDNEVNENKTSAEQSTTDEENVETPRREFADINLTLYNRDRTVKLLLSSDNVEQYEDKKSLQLQSIKIKAYDISDEADKEDGELLYICKAEKGIYNSKDTTLHISGSVSIKQDNVIFSFRELTWSKKEDEIMARGNVKLETEEVIVKSDSFQADSALNKVVFTGNKEKKASLSWKENNNVQK